MATSTFIGELSGNFTIATPNESETKSIATHNEWDHMNANSKMIFTGFIAQEVE